MQTEDYDSLYALEDNYWWFVGMREITSALLDPYCLPAGSSQCVLDAGCGTGGNLKWLSRYAAGGKTMGIDVVEEAIGFCRTRDCHLSARASVTALPFTDSLFDLVTSFDVLGQLPSASSVEEALREMFRVLKPGGIAFVRVAAYECMRSDHDHALATKRRYNLTKLTEVMTHAGFKPLRATYANTFLFPAAAISRLVLKRIGFFAKGSDVKPLAPFLRWLNRLLAASLLLEAKWLGKPNAKSPAGLSAICICQKPFA
ncbi:MAG: methyltransferase domain-containing protein [Pyrinomonadaceae bacterium]